MKKLFSLLLCMTLFMYVAVARPPSADKQQTKEIVVQAVVLEDQAAYLIEPVPKNSPTVALVAVERTSPMSSLEVELTLRNIPDAPQKTDTKAMATPAKTVPVSLVQLE